MVERVLLLDGTVADVQRRLGDNQYEVAYKGDEAYPELCWTVFASPYCSHDADLGRQREPLVEREPTR